MSDPSEPKSRRSRQETKQRLLAAARRWMLEHGRETPIDIRLVDVVREAGMTTGAAYQIWSSQDEFRRDLGVYLASAFAWASPEIIADRSRELSEAGASRRERVRELGRLYFEKFSTNEEYFTVLQLYAVRDPSSELAAALKEGYEIIHQTFVAMFDALLLAEGRRVRAPYTINDVAVVVTAISEGLAMRVRVQPERVRANIPDGSAPEDDWHIYSSALMAVSDYFTEYLADVPE